MKVVHVAETVCVRLVKEVVALRRAGIHCVTVCAQIGTPDLIADLGPIRFYRWRDFAACRQIVQDEAPDVIHVHAEPAGLLFFLKDSATWGKTRFVLDIHDSASLSGCVGEEWADNENTGKAEKKDLGAADFLVLPSPSYAEAAEKMAPDLPRALVRSLAFDATPGQKLPRLGGVCYSGGLSVEGWRDYRRLFGLIADAGTPVFAYAPGAAQLAPEYDPCGAILRHYSHLALLAQLQRHELALVAPPEETGAGAKRWKTALPNKFWEALSVGVPVLTWGCPDIAAEIARYGGGLVCASEAEALDKIRSRILTVTPAQKYQPWGSKVTALPVWPEEIRGLLAAYNSLAPGSVGAGVGFGGLRIL